jgi:hypothetical protein
MQLGVSQSDHILFGKSYWCVHIFSYQVTGMYIYIFFLENARSDPMGQSDPARSKMIRE